MSCATSATAASHATLVRQLHDLGVRPGGLVMLHAGLRKVGPIEGGAEGLLRALQHALGPQGTLIMVLSAVEDVPFDARTSKVDTADMGICAEVFRTFPGVEVNDHAADRFAALGPAAGDLLDPMPLHDYHGPGSVLARFTERDGHVLRLGANVDTVTLTHYAEYLADVPAKRRVRRRYVRADVGEQWIESLDDCDGIVAWPGDDYFAQLYLDYLASGAVRTGAVGRCTAEWLGARDFVAFAVAWMNRELGGAAAPPLD